MDDTDVDENKYFFIVSTPISQAV